MAISIRSGLFNTKDKKERRERELLQRENLRKISKVVFLTGPSAAGRNELMSLVMRENEFLDANKISAGIGNEKLNRAKFKFCKQMLFFIVLHSPLQQMCL